jgi:2-hydroxymuconate-semialdehyde hydrolase
LFPTYPGFGQSAPVERLDLATFARWIISLVQQTHLHRPILVAHSLVGSLTARFQSTVVTPWVSC